jgi:hypothetical protein
LARQKRREGTSAAGRTHVDFQPERFASEDPRSTIELAREQPVGHLYEFEFDLATNLRVGRIVQAELEIVLAVSRDAGVL